MGPDDITSDTLVASNAAVAYGPRYSVAFNDLHTTATSAQIPIESASAGALREEFNSLVQECHILQAITALHENHPELAWTYDASTASLHGVLVSDIITSAPAPLVISATERENQNPFMQMYQQVTVNDLINAAPEPTATLWEPVSPVTSGGYFIAYEPTEAHDMPGGVQLPFTEIQQNYRMGIQADGVSSTIDNQQTQEGFDRLERIHDQHLQTELHRTDDHISYTVEQAVRSVRQIESVDCVYEPTAQNLFRREMAEEASNISPWAIRIPDEHVFRMFDEFSDKERVHSLRDFCAADGRLHLKDQAELQSLMKYLEVTNPRMCLSEDRLTTYKIMNDKYTYIEQRVRVHDEYCMGYAVYDRYGEYPVDEFLELNRDEPEYRDMVEKIKCFYGKDEDNE